MTKTSWKQQRSNHHFQEVLPPMSKRWLKDFLRYINKVFLPEGCTKWAKDERKDPEIEPGTIWVTLLIGFALQVQSLTV